MISLGRPEPYSIRKFLDDQVTAAFSYPEVGATKAELPPGYAVNHTRKQLGRGQFVYDSACEAIRTWQQLQLGWVDCWPHDAPLKVGQNLVIIGRKFGLCWLNACRIAYTIGDPERDARFGFALGTLPDHLATGEERFLVEMTVDENVWIEILAFSRPNTLLARIGYPLMKRAQRRFGRESAGRIQSIVDGTIGAQPGRRAESGKNEPIHL